MGKLLTDATGKQMLEKINAITGGLPNLTTGDKTSLVAAINSVVSSLNTHTNNSAMHDVYAYLDAASTSETGAAIHNSLYRGENLGGSLTTDQVARIADGTFKGLWAGDYWSKSITYNHWKYQTEEDETESTTKTISMRIGDHNYYKGTGDTKLTQNTLIIISDQYLTQAPMNKGQNITTGGYVNSDMRTKYLPDCENAFNAFFGSSHILSYRDALCNAVDNTGRITGYSWYDCKVELMDERQVYGGSVFEGEGRTALSLSYKNTISVKQFNLFRLRPDSINMGEGYGLRNVISPTGFCSSGGNGLAAYQPASIVQCVRPFALIY